MAGDKTFFVPKGSKKRQKIQRGTPMGNAVSIFAFNEGPVPVTLKTIAVSASGKKPATTLTDCWLMVNDDSQLPAVLLPGGKWEGLCSYFWLDDKLGPALDGKTLRFTILDGNGSRYHCETAVSTEAFAAIAKRRLD